MIHKKQPPYFIHLRIHSDYSMIDGLNKTNALVQKAADLNMPALAITDLANLFGLIKFYSCAHKLGIKPIIGADILINNETSSNYNFELTCLASNNIGYKNLISILSKSHKNKNKNQFIPVVTYRLLSKYNEGLLLLSGGYAGDIGQYLIKNNTEKLKECIFFYTKYFFNRYYFEVTKTGKENEIIYLNKIMEISIKKNIPLVATNNVRFIDSKNFEAHQIRIAIHKGETYDNTKKSKKYSSEQFMRSEQEMCELFSDIPESLINTIEIAKRCNVTINLKKFFLPKFPTGNISQEKFLTKCAKKGLEERLVTLFPNNIKRREYREQYIKRLNIELTTINNMGFPGYFLIVMEFIQWAKKNNIPVGPGRGSGASSLVAYALKITDIDPLEFNLIFERFLNPERISMPDLDIDFCMEKRDMVIDHVIKIYGINSVSQIITFSTMTARAVIKDVGRVLGYPYLFVDKISKLVPLEPGITLKKSLNINHHLQKFYNNNEDVKSLINMAYQLEGVIKNVGKHAGGIVISPTKITDFSPLYYDKNGKYSMTQFDKNDIENIGLIKFDFLGLRTLTIIDSTLKIINKNSSNNTIKQQININSIPLNDEKSFKTLQTGETTAIFQLESKGIRELIKRLQPDCFEDIIALIALFRPGPLQSGMVDNFINRKHGREKIFYPDSKWEHKKLQPVLESTYGIILYQEQIIKIAQVLAGYTLENADILRRAIGKKKPKEMIKQRSIFKEGAKKIGINNTLSMKIFDIVEKFAGYGFNKSHSAAYALISYQTLWLKTHYTSEFMISTLNADIDNMEKIIKLINECIRMKIKIFPPNINNNQYHFSIGDNKEIIYGMGAIKGIGSATVEYIIAIRKKHGKFHNLLSLCLFYDTKKLNYRILEKLIFSGACDCFEINRSTLLESLENTIKIAKQYIYNKINHQPDMFTTLLNQPEFSQKKQSIWSEKTLIEKEQETIGIHLNKHPITQYLKEIKGYINIFPSIKTIDQITYIPNNTIITTFGLLTLGKIIKNKNNNDINLCTLNDHTGELEVICPNKLSKKLQNYTQEKSIIFVKGKININNIYNNSKIIAEKIIDINEMRKKYVKSLSIVLTDSQTNHQFLIKLYTFLTKHQQGSLPIYLYHQNNAKLQLISQKSWKIILTDELLCELKKLFNNNQITMNISIN